MEKEELIDKLNELENRFLRDPEVIEMTEKLKMKFDTLFNESFTKEEVASGEFDEMNEEYYSALREDDPDDSTIFQVMWFK
jgi:hypothetical protein